MKDGIWDVKVMVKLFGSLIELLEFFQCIQFQWMGDQLVNFLVWVVECIGIVKFMIIVEGGGYKVIQEIEIEV